MLHESPAPALLYPSQDDSFRSLSVESLRFGDEDAWGVLLLRVEGPLLKLASRRIYRSLRPKVEASDIVQETFLLAHRSRASFRGLSRMNSSPGYIGYFPIDLRELFAITDMSKSDRCAAKYGWTIRNCETHCSIIPLLLVRLFNCVKRESCLKSRCGSSPGKTNLSSRTISFMGSVSQKWQCDATGQNQLFESDGLGQWDVGDVVINACACEYAPHLPMCKELAHLRTDGKDRSLQS